MRLKSFTFIILFFNWSLAYFASGQDTLLVSAEISKNRLVDSLRALNFINYAEKKVTEGEYDSALLFVERSHETAFANSFFLIEGKCYEVAGSVYEKQSEWEETLLQYLRALSLYKRIKDGEKEILILQTLAAKYFGLGIYAMAASYYEQAFTLYPASDLAGLAISSESAALSYYYLPNDTMAVKWYNAAGHYFEKIPDENGSLRCLQKQALVLINLGEYKQAEDKYNQLLEKYSSRGDFFNLAAIFNNLGYLKFKESDFNGALESFLAASENSAKAGTDNFFLTDVYSNIAVCYQNQSKQKEMLESFMAAIKYARSSGRFDEEARISHLLSVVYLRKKDNYHAELYCLDCIEAAKLSAAYPTLQECYRTYSEIMENGNDFISALDYYERYLNLRDSLNFEKRIAEQNEIDRLSYYDNLEQRLRLDIADEEISGLEMKTLKAESERRENELKLLLKQQELDRSEKDRLAQSLALERDRYILAEREQEVLSLQQQQLIDSLEQERLNLKASDLEMANRLLESERIQQVLEIEKEKQVRKFAVGIGILMILVAATILVSLISTRKKNQKLAESKRQIEIINSDLEIKNSEILKQKDIIEQKNQSITDSIQYASRIQSAVLPPADFLSDWGFENFVLYKPKDIVSGDFYWGMTKDDKIIVAAADCTGHGVPGAFMSMLGNAFLDEIVNTTEIEDAAMILNRLRNEVINTLKQRGMVGEARDGMDISLCIIDRKKGKLDFAGANNPLYIVRDSNLIKYPADKMPIGIHVTDLSPFTNNKVEIQKGDLLYLFSDGFADQFGGPKGRKFMYKPFQNLLKNINTESLEKQRDILHKTFVEWMGEHDQVDDVLVIGLRI